MIRATPNLAAPTMRPIAFTTELTRAILAGRKTQTRRLIWPQPDLVVRAPGVPLLVRREGKDVRHRFGQVGALLWVRERFAADPDDDEKLLYAADFPPRSGPVRFRSARAMSRKEARLFLKVVKIDVQRVQDITRNDSLAEGCPTSRNPRQWFAGVWNEVSRETALWEDNPWVWVVHFQRER